MTTKQVQEVIDRHGYIILSSSDRNRIATVYEWNGKECGSCHYNTAERIARNHREIMRWKPYGDSQYIAHYLCKNYVEHENRERCRHIAEELEAFADGRVYRCPECGETIEEPDEHGDVFRCPSCETVCSFGVSYAEPELEQQGIIDFLEDALDIEYRCNSRKEYRSAEVMVAWGGPNIYIDTADSYVKLYWGGENATFPLSYDARDALDEYLEEYFNCI